MEAVYRILTFVLRDVWSEAERRKGRREDYGVSSIIYIYPGRMALILSIRYTQQIIEEKFQDAKPTNDMMVSQILSISPTISSYPFLIVNRSPMKIGVVHSPWND